MQNVHLLLELKDYTRALDIHLLTCSVCHDELIGGEYTNTCGRMQVNFYKWKTVLYSWSLHYTHTRAGLG
jgi:hypothetical protein